MDINESDKIKASAFITRLNANPALKSFSALQREEQIYQFLTVNASQLYPTLASQAFFAGKSWENIFRILMAVLYGTTNEEVLPELNILVNKLDFTFFSLLDHSEIDEAAAKNTVVNLLTRMLSSDQARRVFSGAIAAVNNDIVKNFVSEIYQRRKYIHFEIIKVEKLRMGEQEIENMISLVMLLRPLIYMFASQGTASKNTVNGLIFTHKFAVNTAGGLSVKAPQIPAAVFESAMNSNISFADNPKLQATARISNIITSMCRNYKPESTKDRGADSAMKSWINVARKNYKFYGYDINMLDELYSIAAENGW